METAGDEVEDMAALLAYAQERFPVRTPWETCCRNTANADGRLR